MGRIEIVGLILWPIGLFGYGDSHGVLGVFAVIGAAFVIWILSQALNHSPDGSGRAHPPIVAFARTSWVAFVFALLADLIMRSSG